VQVVVKGHEFEVKNSWELRILRAIDYGEDDVEIVISFDAADYKIRFVNSLERDETLWIIVQCCKLFIGVDVSVGYAVDIDSIGYTISTNGSLNRFPLLLSLTSNLRISGDTFTEQEADAEDKLEELKWTEHGGTPQDLQQILSKETELINMEMIDFLLKWEDEGDSKSNSKNKGDTFDILNSLSAVDEELEGVDLWLTEQLDKLASVQEKLYSIEKETGSVEASFQNLTSVKDILETFLEEMYFTTVEQDYLQHPERLIEDALDQEDLSNADELLSPLNTALGKLQLGLAMNEKKLQARLDEKRKEVGSTYQGAHISRAQWKRLQAMTAFASQRNLLIDLADSFSNSVNDVAGTLFDSLLKHKSLNNPSTQNITVKKFNFERMIQEGLAFGPSYFNKNNSPDSDNGRRDFNDTRARHDSVNSAGSDGNYIPQLKMVTTKKLNNSNQAIIAQRVFHGALNDFIPILEAILHLTPNLAISLSSSYVQSVYTRLYSPLLKLMLKEIRHMLHPRASPLQLSNVPVFTLKYIFTGCPLPLRFDQHQYKDCGMLTAWGALGLAFLMLSPVIKREESFFDDIFHLDDKALGKDDSNNGTGNKSKTEVMLDNLFAIIPEQIEKFMSHPGTLSGSEVDGVETLAMLVTLEIYMNDNLGCVEHEGVMHIIKETDEYSPYFVQLLQQIKSKFISRLELYMSEQVYHYRYYYYYYHYHHHHHHHN